MLSSLLAASLIAAPPAIDSKLRERIDRLLAARTPEETRAAAAEIEDDADFETALRALGEERRYPRDVPVGLIEDIRRNRDGTYHRYLLAVPEDYAPGRRYPVRVLLHGGIARPAWRKGGDWWREAERLVRGDRISVVPASWEKSRWWDASQVENVAAILRDVKRRYDVDENRICQVGISDGGTGAWFFAFKDPTPWAAFLSFIGHPGVISNPASTADGALFVENLTLRPFFVVNGSHDPQYPADSVRPLVRRFEEAGAQVRFEVVEGGGHDVRWWRQRAAEIDAFIEAHPRDPLPDRVLWATDRTDRYNRASWVVIEELAPGERPRRREPEAAWLGEPPERAGWVEATRSGNRIEVRSGGVRRYRLLLAPSELDLAEEVVVTTNGRESFRGRVEPQLDTLLRWAVRDVDRTMLFAAELAVEVPALPE